MMPYILEHTITHLEQMLKDPHSNFDHIKAQYLLTYEGVMSLKDKKEVFRLLRRLEKSGAAVDRLCDFEDEEAEQQIASSVKS